MAIKLWYRVFEEAGDGDGGGSGGGDPGSSGNDGDPGTGGDGGDGGDPGGGTGSGEVQAKWPDNWRELMAGDNEKLANLTKRYTDPNAFAKAYLNAQQQITSGRLKMALPEKPTETELAEYRKSNGIPEKPEQYHEAMKFDEGFKIGDDDKPVVDAFLGIAHSANITPQQAQEVVKWYFQDQERQISELDSMDENQKQEALDTLNADWGGNFRSNWNAVENMLNTMPESVRDLFLNARLADGRAVMNNPDVVKTFAQWALDMNPAGSLVPPDTEASLKTIEGRIKEIREVMRTDRRKYNSDKGLQEEFQKLLQAQEKIKEQEQKKSA